MHSELIPVVLAGGSGTRLWPLSRGHYPKQFLPLNGRESLLQQTVLRLDGLGAGINVQPPMVVSGELYRHLIVEQLDAVNRPAGHLILEPVGRNTAAALCLAAAVAVRDGEDPLLLALPSDHVICDRTAFHAAVARAAQAADRGAVVTFGVVPSRAETGYGYIELGGEIDADTPSLRRIQAFVEKPDAQRAASYVQDGGYVWNGGMFLVRASVWARAIHRFAPNIGAACDESMLGSTVDGRFVRPEKEAFSSSPGLSIDVAVMERLTGGVVVDDDDDDTGVWGAVVSLDAGWSDLGSWPAVFDLGPVDEHGNVVLGDTFVRGATGSLVISSSRLVSLLGIDDAVVVETPDAVLVAAKDSAQDVREVVGWLERSGRPEGDVHLSVHRPWGSFERVDAGDGYCVKRLTVNPGAAISLQSHRHRAEHWVVVRGMARVTRGEDQFFLVENNSTFIAMGDRHRLENPGTERLEVIEVQTGKYLGEDDIIRYEDLYDRLEEE